MEIKNHCANCPTNVHCCKFQSSAGFTFVGLADARRIQKKTKKNYAEFLEYTPLPQQTVDALKHDDPSLEGTLRFSQLDRKNRILRLRKKEDKSCIFLDSQGKCSIYDVRPNICRIYPLWAVRLISRKMKVIPHGSQSSCGILTTLTTKNEDVEKNLSDKEIAELKSIFRNIEKENVDYKKNIKRFSEKHLLKQNI